MKNKNLAFCAPFCESLQSCSGLSEGREETDEALGAASWIRHTKMSTSLCHDKCCTLKMMCTVLLQCNYSCRVHFTPYYCSLECIHMMLQMFLATSGSDEKST